MNDPIEEAFASFTSVIEEKERRRRRRRQVNEKIAAQKAELLLPFRKLLKRFEDMRLVVYNSDRYVRPQPTEAFQPQIFRVYEDESSDSWFPGISLFFDHPAQIEIAIPNERDREKVGVVVIRCATDHPYRDMLMGPFHTLDSGLHALSSFLAKSTVRIDAPENAKPFKKQAQIDEISSGNEKPKDEH